MRSFITAVKLFVYATIRSNQAIRLTSIEPTGELKLKKALVFLLFVVGLYVMLDTTVCNGMRYHDYAAGIDRSFHCPWKK